MRRRIYGPQWVWAGWSGVIDVKGVNVQTPRDVDVGTAIKGVQHCCCVNRCETSLIVATGM